MGEYEKLATRCLEILDARSCCIHKCHVVCLKPGRRSNNLLLYFPSRPHFAKVDGSSLAQLVSDIRQFIHVYGPEHVLTARAIARVFHGIDSPRFPATTWGRVRRFWRSHLHVHFNIVLREIHPDDDVVSCFSPSLPSLDKI
ncbi:hypothetical protein BaRGS_00008476, partial [Batillaria attramentaria]